MRHLLILFTALLALLSTAPGATAAPVTLAANADTVAGGSEIWDLRTTEPLTADIVKLHACVSGEFNAAHTKVALDPITRSDYQRCYELADTAKRNLRTAIDERRKRQTKRQLKPYTRCSQAIVEVRRLTKTPMHIWQDGNPRVTLSQFESQCGRAFKIAALD